MGGMKLWKRIMISVVSIIWGFASLDYLYYAFRLMTGKTRSDGSYDLPRDGAAQLAMEGGRSMKLLRVLLVDDEIMIREGFKRLFDWQAHGCEVVGEAADGVQALSQMEELKPDIVVMDINIPLMNGLKVISL